MVITSTIGNRVAVMSGTWVQIPPSPPRRGKPLGLPRFIYQNAPVLCRLPLLGIGAGDISLVIYPLWCLCEICLK